MRQPSGGWFQGVSAPSVDLGDVPEPLAAGDVAHRPGRVGARLAPARARSGPRRCGCTTTAPLSTSLSSSGPCATNTGRRSSTCTARCRSRAARGGRAVDAVPLRRAGRAGQGEPRHHLAEGREPCRRRRRCVPGGHRPRDRGRSPVRAAGVRGGRDCTRSPSGRALGRVGAGAPLPIEQVKLAPRDAVRWHDGASERRWFR